MAADGGTQQFLGLVHQAMALQLGGLDDQQGLVLGQCARQPAPGLAQGLQITAPRRQFQQGTVDLQAEPLQLLLAHHLAPSQLRQQVAQALPILQALVELHQHFQYVGVARGDLAQVTQGSQCLLQLAMGHLQLRLAEPHRHIGLGHAAVGQAQVMVTPIMRTLLLGGAGGGQIGDQGVVAGGGVAHQAFFRRRPLPLRQFDETTVEGRAGAPFPAQAPPVQQPARQAAQTRQKTHHQVQARQHRQQHQEGGLQAPVPVANEHIAGIGKRQQSHPDGHQQGDHGVDQVPHGCASTGVADSSTVAPGATGSSTAGPAGSGRRWRSRRREVEISGNSGRISWRRR